MVAIRKILCPTDFSEASGVALKVAQELAEKFSAEIMLVHVVQLNAALGAGPMMALDFDLHLHAQRMTADAQEQIERLVSERFGDTTNLSVRIEKGSPPEVIDAVARETGADMVVVATHGHSAFHQFVFGSVAEKLIRISSAPVLVIRAPG